MLKNPKLTTMFGLLLFLVLPITGCIDDEGDSSGGSGSAPSSVIGKKLVQTITENDGRPTTISVGSTITYQFIDSTTILGAGDNVVATTSWSYRRTGSNTAHVELIYQGGASYTDEYLTFNTETSGTFETEGMAGSTPGEYKGTFQISDISGGSSSGGDDGDDDGDGDSGGGDGTAVCETNNTGSLTFWISYSGFSGSVTTDVDGLGTRSTSSYFTGSGPECGSTQTGAMTFTDIPATTYDYNATDSGNVTWTGSVPVSTCGCSRVELF